MKNNEKHEEIKKGVEKMKKMMDDFLLFKDGGCTDELDPLKKNYDLIEDYEEDKPQYGDCFYDWRTYEYGAYEGF